MVRETHSRKRHYNGRTMSVRFACNQKAPTFQKLIEAVDVLKLSIDALIIKHRLAGYYVCP